MNNEKRREYPEHRAYQNLQLKPLVRTLEERLNRIAFDKDDLLKCREMMFELALRLD